ncbi:hypothetical protein GCM10027565_09580 [Bordetella tumulicola]
MLTDGTLGQRQFIGRAREAAQPHGRLEGAQRLQGRKVSIGHDSPINITNTQPSQIMVCGKLCHAPRLAT